MKITKELLEKYARGECSEAEKYAIENWLPTDDDRSDSLSKEVVDKQEKKVWNNILLHQKSLAKVPYENNPTSERSSKPVYQLLTRVSAAACFALIFYLAGALFPNPFTKKVSPVKIVEVAYPEPEQALYVSTINGKPEKISAKEYNIDFEGMIRLYNVAESDRTIVCNGKQIKLAPEKEYFLMYSRSNGFYRIDALSANHIAEDEEVSKFYKVCVKS